MIGISLNTSDLSTVSEFFELFKTPWEIVAQGRAYDAIITDQRDVARFNAKMIISLRDANDSDREATIGNPEIIRNTNGDSLPIFCGVQPVRDAEEILYTSEAHGAVASRRLWHGQAEIQLGYHLFQEFKFILNQGQPLSVAAFPTIDIHIENLRSWLIKEGIVVIEIPPVPFGNKFIACLTHDVDFAGIKNHLIDKTMVGFLYRALVASTVRFFKKRIALKALLKNWFAVLTLPLVVLGFKKDFWYQLNAYRKLERWTKGTFFFVPEKNCPGRTSEGNANSTRAVKYDVTKLKKEIDLLVDDGFEIGVHGIDSWFHIDSAKSELNKIKTLSEQDELGIRMHWLYLNQKSLALLDSAGYKYDSTWGYNEKVGFRAGTFQVFKPSQSKSLFELPLHIMDTALFYPDRMNLTFQEGLTSIQSLIDMAVQFGGALTFNWHHRSIAPERLWDGIYVEVLSILQKCGARFMTAADVVDWFESRRNLCFEEVKYDNTRLLVKVSQRDQGSKAGLPPSQIRVHLPRFLREDKDEGDGGGCGYKDCMISDQEWLEIPI